MNFIDAGRETGEMTEQTEITKQMESFRPVSVPLSFVPLFPFVPSSLFDV
jgi:hypothetical protein